MIHFLQYMYFQRGAWYQGSIWSNVFVIPVVAILGYIWSRGKWWPLKPIEHGLKHLHSKVDALDDRHDAHDKHLSEIAESLKSLHLKHDLLAKQVDQQNRDDAASTAEDDQETV